MTGWPTAALAAGAALGVDFLAAFEVAFGAGADGAGADGMSGPLRTTYEAMPDPRVVIAAGTDAVSGGLLRDGDQTTGGVGAVVPVDLWLPGSPPSPFGLLTALLIAVGRLTADRRRSR